MARPFIKWVGGKNQLLGDLLPLIPQKIRTYYEPFIGGGAVFFALTVEQRFEHATINDWNAELVETYRVVRDFPDDLMKALREREDSYAAGPQPIYQHWREMDPKTLSPVERAMRFIFLNKTGFNGLYRVNKAGKFNVPWGHKLGRVALFDEDNIRECSTVLSKTIIMTGDFAEAVYPAAAGDVVYFDPPYVPVSATSDFTSYTADGFSMVDQKRLAGVFKQLAAKSVHVLLSNSNSQAIRDLYAEFEIHEVNAKRNVNSKGDARGAVKELLVISRPKVNL
jgi:DNA adenine methylase